jgi:hypothetical protein
VCAPSLRMMGLRSGPMYVQYTSVHKAETLPIAGMTAASRVCSVQQGFRWGGGRRQGREISGVSRSIFSVRSW